MDRLLGKSILIGKDSGSGKLCIAVVYGKSVATALLGEANSVPMSVSRYRPNEGIAHCKIEYSDTQILTITNMKSANTTCVNGIEVAQKSVTTDDSITLGSDSYPLDLAQVLHTAIQLTATLPDNTDKTYSLAPLEAVYEDYERTIETIQRRQQRMNKRRMLPLIIGSLSTLLAPIISMTDIGNKSLYITLPVAAGMFIIYIILYNTKDTSIEERKAATDKLIDSYVCPNPQCRHFLGHQPYKVLRQMKKCPYCGCKLTDK